MVLELRALGGLLSCGGGVERGQRGHPSHLPRPGSTPSYLQAKLPEQHVQCRVPQGHGGEEFLYPLAPPPLAATGRAFRWRPSAAPAPAWCPGLTPVPRAARTSTCRAGPAHRWAGACGRGTWPHRSGSGVSLWGWRVGGWKPKDGLSRAPACPAPRPRPSRGPASHSPTPTFLGGPSVPHLAPGPAAGGAPGW